MRAFMILAFVAVVTARPEAGYNYNAPNRGQQASAVSSFGQSGAGVGTSSFNGAIGLSQSVGYSGQGSSAYSGQGSSGYSGQGSSGYSGQASSGYSGQALSGFGGQSGFSSQGSSGFSGQSYSGGLSSGVSSSSFASGAPQTLIQKHIYVHVPPPEPEVVHRQQQIQAGVAQKHYKIIFIKAPSPPAPTPAQIALAQQSQEKTIVYVLVKKPDEIGDVSIPTVAPTQPSKPEVYFIKYKTQSAPQINASELSNSHSLTSIHGGRVDAESTGGTAQLFTAPPSVYGPPAAPAPSYGPPAQSGPY